MTNYKPFCIEAAKRGEAVVTRKGFGARIICFDHIGQYPIIALLRSSDGTQETIQQYRLDGSYSQNNIPFDLFMAAPAIPDGFTAYDPDVPPPENAEEIEFMPTKGNNLFHSTRFRMVDDCDWDQWNISYYRVTKWKEAKTSLEDIIQDFSCVVNHTGCTNDGMINLVSQLAEAIVQRAVDKSREDRG